MVIRAKTLDEISQEYARYINEQVFNFLENNGYKVEERNTKGAEKILKILKIQNKKIIIAKKRENLRREVIDYVLAFEIEIKFKEKNI